MSNAEQLDLTFAALAHPLRRGILAQLAKGDATVNELSKPFNVSLPAVSRHLKVLERAGLITRSQDAQFRPCKLNPAPIEEIATWTETYRPIWEARFDKMESILSEIRETGRDD